MLLSGCCLADKTAFNSCIFFSGEMIAQPPMDHIARNKLWTWKTWVKKTCRGTMQRYICIPSVNDLPRLANAPELFFNKLRWGYSPGDVWVSGGETVEENFGIHAEAHLDMAHYEKIAHR